MPADSLSVEYLRQCFSYNSGQLVWKVRPRGHFATDLAWAPCNGRLAGKVAGHIGEFASGTRWRIRLDRANHQRSVLVWAYHHGWPARLIDHKNLNKLDDRIENLREADFSLNAANTKLRCTNTSGYKGVTWNKRAKKWKVKIKVKGIGYHLGYFTDQLAAHHAYCAAAKEHFGEFAHKGE